jgi:uncharacterized membrane protein
MVIKLNKSYSKQETTIMSNTIHQYGKGDNFGGDKVMGNKIGTEFNNHLEGANIGNFANELKDHAQQSASNFTQTIGTNTAELLQIINSLRQTATQFPEATREDIIIDIDDVEAEIKKPTEQRNNRKLKKCLTALLSAVGVFINQIPAATDFMNNALDLASKLNIELLLPHKP